jgi:glycosyltransferase involved in cell wall biosynthesis
VLVSSRCGCTPDLVRDGENGFAFDPGDGAALEAGLRRIAGLSPSVREAMGRRSREIVAEFTPEAFAAALVDACTAAKSRTPAPRLARLWLRCLAMRTVDKPE